MPHDQQDHRIILLDLNFTLSANGDERYKVKPFARFVRDHEQYRQWLVELVRPHRVVLITARPDSLRDVTIESIGRKTDWLPELALFNDTGIMGRLAPAIKEKLVRTWVYPEFGDDPHNYLALESNRGTRAMYAKLGIHAERVPTEEADAWLTLPPPTHQQATLM